jgi:hypothetical protein
MFSTKDKVYGMLKDSLEKYLLGFDPVKDFNASILSTEKLNLKNAILNVKEVNAQLSELGVDIELKAGIIGKISVKVSYYNTQLTFLFLQTNMLTGMFSNSFFFEVSDIYIILGRSIKQLTEDDWEGYQKFDPKNPNSKPDINEDYKINFEKMTH